jgi:LPXTG-site transpeptidase (sortase) family protein
MIRERRGPHRSAALSVVGQRLSEETGLGRWPVMMVGGFVVLLLAVVILLQATHLMPGASRAVPGTSKTTLASGAPRSSTTVRPATSNDATTPGTSATPSTGLHPIEDPVRIVIPAIGVDAQMVHVGNQPNGSMQVPPYGLAAWYRQGPQPGAAGPSVIIGHVDSKKKADVFHRLNALKPGDVILVFDKSGDVATFQADSSELVLKKDLPKDRIWNNTSQPVLRLITCGGKWDASIGHYLSNLIVYAHLVK